MHTYCEQEKRENKNSIIKQLILGILTFFTIYRMLIPGIPAQLSSTRICVVILALWALFEQGLKFRIGNTCTEVIFRKLLLICLAFALYGGILVLMNGGGTGLTFSEEAIEFILCWGLCFYALTHLYSDVDELMKALFIISLIQTAVIFGGILNSSFRLFIDNTFNSLSYWNLHRNAEEMYQLGYAYGIGCMTSTGSLQLSLGAIASVYYMIKHEKRRILFLMAFLLITFASTMVSRSGLIFNLLIIAVYFLSHLKPNQILKTAVIVLIGIGVVWWLMFQSPWADTIISRFSRLFLLFERGAYNSYFIGYNASSASIPPFRDIIICGVGFTSGTTQSGYTVNIDGGYLRTYAALGLVFAILIYFVFVSFFVKQIKVLRHTKYFALCLSIVTLIFLGEGKEQTVFGFMTCFFFAITFFLEKKKQENGRPCNSMVDCQE